MNEPSRSNDDAVAAPSAVESSSAPAQPSLSSSESKKKPAPLPTFTKDEVRKHNTAQDCWVTYRGGVYRLPCDWIYKSHPGGPYLLGCAGSDATTTFDDNAHTETSREILNEFLIGTLSNLVEKTPASESPVAKIQRK